MLNLVRFWILLSTVLVGAGWILSALHQLNRVGYVVILLPFAAWALFWWPKVGLLSSENIRRWRCKFFKRYRRRPPQMFLLIAALSFLGGCLYPPLNYDANAYRLPRVMHWLAAGQWHWMHAYDGRMNVAACGMEWLSAPLILFSHTDRLLFLINCISYLMLPGLIFSVFIRLQIRPRTAWWWTWLLSAGLCFVLQAGSAANDLIAVIYMLAAVDLALRAGENKSVTDLWLSLLAAALVTGAKQTNLPLVALWCIAAWPARMLLWKNSLRSAAVVGVGLLVSVVPISVLNYLHCGSWMPLGANGIGVAGKSFQMNPFWGIIGNAFCIPVQNFVPPFYSLIPVYSYWPISWNEWMRQFLQTPLGAHFTSFQDFGYMSVSYYHGLSEANAGLGLGIVLMIFVTVRELQCLKKRSNRFTVPAIEPLPILNLLRLAPWGLLLVFMAKNGAFENARHLAPYYPFLFPVWLVRTGHSQVTRQREWQYLGLGTMVVAALLLVTVSERPLFPAQTVFRFVHSRFSNGGFLSDECGHYLESIYQITLGRRHFLQEKLLPGEMVVGYYDKLTSIDESGLWLPFGKRRVECVLQDDPPERLHNLGIHYLVVNGSTVRSTYGSIDKWTARYKATVVDQYVFPRLTPKWSGPPDIYIVRLD